MALKRKLINSAVILGLLILVLIYYIVVQFIFALVIDNVHGMQEFIVIGIRYLVMGLAIPLILSAVGLWLWLIGKFLKIPKARRWGKRLLWLYVIVGLVPFLITFSLSLFFQIDLGYPSRHIYLMLW